MAKKAAPKAAQGKAAPAPAAKAAPGKAAPAPAAKAATQGRPRSGHEGPTQGHRHAGPRPTQARQQDRGLLRAGRDDRAGQEGGRRRLLRPGRLIAKELGKQGPGQFVVPGLLKLKVVRKPATKARPGKNPFTGEPMTIQAKPARNVVRALPLKALKEMV